MKKTNSFLVFLFFAFSIQAQDFVLSQFNQSPLNVSPSLSGTSGGDQVVVNYRNQWFSVLDENSYKTYAISYDRPFVLKNGDRVGAGIRAFKDVAGSLDFTQNYGSLALSYQKKILEKNEVTHFIGAGIEGGLFQRTVDLSDARWGNQHNGNGGFDSILVSGENLEASTPWRGDFSAGINYLIEFQNGRKIVIGTALNHLLKPNLSFSENQESPLSRRFNFYSMVDIGIDDDIQITPAVFYTRQVGNELILASVSTMFSLKENQFGIAIGGRFGAGSIDDPVVVENRAFFITPTFFFKNQIGIAATFESNAIELSKGGLDSFEGSIIYRFGKNKQPNLEE